MIENWGFLRAIEAWGFLRASRDLKTESVVLGFRETNWKPF